jgi:hypothetical protein
VDFFLTLYTRPYAPLLMGQIISKSVTCITGVGRGVDVPAGNSKTLKFYAQSCLDEEQM